jgi:hypothetical protein
MDLFLKVRRDEHLGGSAADNRLGRYVSPLSHLAFSLRRRGYRLVGPGPSGRSQDAAMCPLVTPVTRRGADRRLLTEVSVLGNAVRMEAMVFRVIHPRWLVRNAYEKARHPIVGSQNTWGCGLALPRRHGTSGSEKLSHINRDVNPRRSLAKWEVRQDRKALRTRP